MIRYGFLALVAALLAGCTFHHSKQAVFATARTPTPKATFVSEEDSGLSLFGLIALSEPDHYSVLVERARRRYQCSELHSYQLDYFTDYWIIVAFPIARVTAVCEAQAPAPEMPTPVVTSTTG